MSLDLRLRKLDEPPQLPADEHADPTDMVSGQQLNERGQKRGLFSQHHCLLVLVLVFSYSFLCVLQRLLIALSLHTLQQLPTRARAPH